MNQIENFPNIHIYNDTKTQERINIQRIAATESMILLKNEDNNLPIKNVKKIPVIGNDTQKKEIVYMLMSSM